MRILASGDPRRLEAAWVEGVRDALEDEPGARVLTVTPTSRLTEHLRALLAGSGPAWLGCEFATYRGLTHKVLRETGGYGIHDAPPVLRSAVRDDLLERLARERGDGLADYLAVRPGAVHALGRSFTSLRDAGVSAGSLREVPGIDPVLADLFEGYEAAVERLGEADLPDGPALARAATARAATWAEGFRAAFHYGAYEVVESNAELLRALARRVPLTWYVPADLEYAGAAYAREALLRVLPGESLDEARRSAGFPQHEEGVDDRREIQGADGQAGGDGDPGAPRRGRRISAPDPAGELRWVAQDILADDDGPPLERIGIVARSLEPFGSHLQEVLDRHGIPFTTSYREPLLRHPYPQALSLLVRVLVEDFPREATSDLLRHPLFRLDTLLPDGLDPQTDRWARWAADAGIDGGHEAWIALEPEARRRSDDEQRTIDPEASRQRKALVEVLERLREELRDWRRLGSWGEHACFLEELAGRRLALPGRPPGAPDAQAPVFAVGEALEELGRIELGRHVLPGSGATGPAVAPADAAGRLARLLERSRLPVAGSGSAGVRVLDAEQARALSFDRLYLIGFTASRWPRRSRTDAFLPEALRERIRKETGAPLPPVGPTAAEERLLLTMLASSAPDLAVSHHRADADDRPQTVSHALRDVRRLRPELDGAEIRIPGHPVEAARWFADPGRGAGVDAGEAALAVAAPRADGSPPLLAFQRALERKLVEARSLELLTAVEEFEPPAGRFDGAVDPDDLPTISWSPSRLQGLARCPLKSWIGTGLRIPEPEDPPGIGEIASGPAGRCVHRLLQAVFDELAGATPDGSLPDTGAESVAREAMDRHWDEAWRPVAETLGRRYPLLWEHRQSVWREALGTFLDRELTRLRDAGARAIETEVGAEARVEIGSGEEAVALRLRGVWDRAARLEPIPAGALEDGPLLVTDYKTGGSDPGKFVRRSKIVRGKYLQAPLYLAVGATRSPRPRVEFVGVGPDQLGDDGRPVEPAPFGPEDLESLEDELAETVGTLFRLRDAGRFPFRRDGHCRWCGYRPACRRDHYPSVIRTESDSRHRDYYLRVGQKIPPAPGGDG